MVSGVVLYVIVFILLLISFSKSREKTILSLKKSFDLFKNLLPDLLAIMLFVSLSLSILSPDKISIIIGEQSGVIGIIVSIIIGSLALIPSFIVFPLGATLLENNAGLPQVAALVSSLMAIGIVSFPVESKIFGMRFAILRNLGAFIFTILFTFVIWVVM